MKRLSSNKKVMVFGVFDRLHPGHVDFLMQAKEYGSVIAVVARDDFVKSFKGKNSLENQEIRLKEVATNELVTEAVLADEVIGSYGVIKKYAPDIILVGYDQIILEEDLKRLKQAGNQPSIPIIRLNPHIPEEFHSSFSRIACNV